MKKKDQNADKKSNILFFFKKEKRHWKYILYNIDIILAI